MSEERTMRVELMFPSKYLRAADFLGKTVTKTIKRVDSDKLKMQDGSSEKKYIVHFEDTEKMLVLNKTNAYKIADVLGEKDAMKWAGREISLYPTTCQCFGKTVDCIRVKE
jgi:hypothetical protein